MNLYIWNEPFSVRYGGSVIYAVAETEDEARIQARAARVSEYGYDPTIGAPKDMDIDRPPDRVMGVPCAEIYQWSE